jgi:hypothetical protein
MINLQLIIGIIFNMLTSLAPRIPSRSTIAPEHLFKKYYIVGLIVSLYYLSFLIILFSPGNKFINLGICLLLHLVINPLIGVIRGR